MIGYLMGKLLFRHDPFLTINVGGVGYKVYASSDVLAAYHVGQDISVHIHTHIREDALELYGFLNEGSLGLFELLISVSGIGPKTAISIFAQGKKEEILQAIQKADVDFFTGVPRLGKKNAQKIIIELRNKLGSVEDIDLQEDGEGQEIINALASFGFSTQESRKALQHVKKEGQKMSETIRLALKYLGK